MSDNYLQEQLDRLAAGATLKLEPAGREFQGPLIIRRQVILEGQGATLWATHGPVLTIEADGVELKGLNVEVTSNEANLDGADACALVVAPGRDVTLGGVSVRGNVLGLDTEEGDWRYPRAIPLGSLQAGQGHAFKVRLLVPVPCRVQSRIDGLAVEPGQIESGLAEITLKVDPLAPGTLLRGELWLQTPLLTRRIMVNGNFAGAHNPRAIVGTGQILSDVVGDMVIRPPQPAADAVPTMVRPASLATTRTTPGTTEPLSVPASPGPAALVVDPTPFSPSVGSVPLHPVPPQLVVSKLEEGAFHTLAEALRNATHGTRIHVRPGLYKESLVLDKRVEIVGDGPRSDIVLESADGCCVRMQTDHARVRGLTLRGGQGRAARPRPAVSIPQGQLVLEDCEVTSEGTCLAIHGAQAMPLIRWCKIHGSKSAGVLVYDRAEGVLEDCDISGSALAGVEIRQGGNPVLRRCHIHDGDSVGVFVHDHGKGVLENCDIAANALAGVEIGQGGNPILRHCKIHDGKYPGLRVLDSGRGTVEDCDIFANALAGVEVGKGGQPTLRKCRIHDGRQAGLLFTDKALGTVEDCVVSGNTLAGVEIRQGSNPTLRRCRILAGKEVGVAVVGQSQGALEDCEILENAQAGVLVRQGSNPTLRQCRIHQGQQAGVLVCDRGAAVLEGCDISGNGWAEVAVVAESTATLRKCRIHDGRCAGLLVGKDSKVGAEECALSGHAVAGVVLARGGHGVLRRCQIKSNGIKGQDGKRTGAVGVWAFDGAEGRVEKCDLGDNPEGPTCLEADSSVALQENVNASN